MSLKTKLNFDNNAFNSRKTLGGELFSREITLKKSSKSNTPRIHRNYEVADI